jgi:hypothetical protein
MCAICNGASMEQVRRGMLARIAEHDYTVVGVNPERMGRRRLPGFAYSVGLWSFRGVPEVIVVGAKHCCASAMIQAYATHAQHPDAPKVFYPGSVHYGIMSERPVVFEQVDRARYEEWFAMAFHLYPGGDFAAIQMLWPDRRGRWPWDPRWRINP